jgi:hypothetical protein
LPSIDFREIQGLGRANFNLQIWISSYWSGLDKAKNYHEYVIVCKFKQKPNSCYSL